MWDHFIPLSEISLLIIAKKYDHPAHLQAAGFQAEPSIANQGNANLPTGNLLK